MKSINGNVKGENIIKGKIKSFVIDKTLTKSGYCADAKVTGDMLADLKAKQEEYATLIKAYQSIVENLNNLISFYEKSNTTIWEGSLTAEDSQYGAHRTGKLAADPFDFNLFAFECEYGDNNRKETLIAYKHPTEIANEYKLESSRFCKFEYDESGMPLEHLSGIKLRLAKLNNSPYFLFQDDFVSYRGDTFEKGLVTIKRIIGII